MTGANGQLGSEIGELAKNRFLNDFRFFFTDVDELDITDEAAVEKFYRQHRINAVINCAAYTNVDKAESDECLAYKINASGPQVLAEKAKEQDIVLVHISTDYVFDGTAHMPYRESDPVSPAGVYGKSKLEGERHVRQSDCRSVIIRTSWLYSSYGNNFVKTMRRLGKERDSLRVVSDQIGTPTYAGDLAAAVLAILPSLAETPRYGEVYHFSNEGVASWYDFACMIFRLSGMDCLISPIESKDYPSATVRPFYSVMNKSKIKTDFGIDIPYWVDSLQKCISLLKKENGCQPPDLTGRR